MTTCPSVRRADRYGIPRDRARSGLSGRDVVVYVVAQIVGGIGGAGLANLMFEVPTVVATAQRVTAGALLGEVVAAAGLVVLITGLPH